MVRTLDQQLRGSNPGLPTVQCNPNANFWMCKILSRSAEIWQYEGQKPVLE